MDDVDKTGSRAVYHGYILEEYHVPAFKDVPADKWWQVSLPNGTVVTRHLVDLDAAKRFVDSEIKRNGPLAKTIPTGPDELEFPPSFYGMNEFCKALTAGGEVIFTTPHPSSDPAHPGKECVTVAHMDKEDIFEVTRIDDDTFSVRRLKRT